MKSTFWKRRIETVCLLVLVGAISISAQSSTVFGQDDSKVKTKSSDQTTTSIDLSPIFAGAVDPNSLDELRAFQDHVAKLAERVKKATVNIQVGQAQGSGVIISRDGLILTAAHVIGRPGVKALIKMPDGKEYEAKTKGLVHGVDSGMLQITDKGKWDYLDLGESAPIEKGQWVMAIGHPGGWDVDNRGLVIRLGRVNTATSRVLGTDCTLVGGDSGGPLVDMSGAVVGINSRIGGKLSQNMHVPIDVFTEGWENLENDVEIGGSRRRGQPYLGLTLGTEEKLKIAEIKKDGPAEKAGLKVGDVITHVGDTKVSNRIDFQAAYLKLKIDQEVDVVVLRDRKKVTLKLKVTKQP